METACILAIRCGAGCATANALGDTLQSVVGARYEIKELVLPASIRNDDLDSVALAIRRENPRILIFSPAGRRSFKEMSKLLNLGRLNGRYVPAVVAVERQQLSELLEIVKLGVSDFLTLPFCKEELLARLWALDHGFTDEVDAGFAGLLENHGFAHIVGKAPAFLGALRELPKLAKCDSAVLVKGETGTGKEIVARAIHHLSPRCSKPFVAVNCGAIPLDLIENEFFGHEPGAFTSANALRRGVVQEAEGGTLFLDEIDSLPPAAQVKLLRFLQDGHFRPLGSERGCQGNVRVIAASNTDFAEALESGRFRKDLYYRLNVLSVSLPPLRERPGDVLLLARHFLTRLAERLGAVARDFAPAARLKLCCHDWPGNVRELENVVERAVVLAEQPIVQQQHIRLHDVLNPVRGASFRELKAQAIERFEKGYLRQALSAHGGNITKAAESAQKDRRAFWELLRKHRIVARPQPSPGSRFAGLYE